LFFAAFHTYLGIKNAETLTDKKLERIEDYGAISCDREKSGLSETEFEKRYSACWREKGSFSIPCSMPAI
jgi:hypothetical protein